MRHGIVALPSPDEILFADGPNRVFGDEALKESRVLLTSYRQLLQCYPEDKYPAVVARLNELFRDAENRALIADLELSSEAKSPSMEEDSIVGAQTQFDEDAAEKLQRYLAEKEKEQHTGKQEPANPQFTTQSEAEQPDDSRDLLVGSVPHIDDATVQQLQAWSEADQDIPTNPSQSAYSTDWDKSQDVAQKLRKELEAGHWTQVQSLFDEHFPVLIETNSQLTCEAFEKLVCAQSFDFSDDDTEARLANVIGLSSHIAEPQLQLLELRLCVGREYRKALLDGALSTELLRSIRKGWLANRVTQADCWLKIKREFTKTVEDGHEMLASQLDHLQLYYPLLYKCYWDVESTLSGSWNTQCSWADGQKAWTKSVDVPYLMRRGFRAGKPTESLMDRLRWLPLVSLAMLVVFLFIDTVVLPAAGTTFLRPIVQWGVIACGGFWVWWGASSAYSVWEVGHQNFSLSTVMRMVFWPEVGISPMNEQRRQHLIGLMREQGIWPHELINEVISDDTSALKGLKVLWPDNHPLLQLEQDKSLLVEVLDRKHLKRISFKKRKQSVG